jgi:hypothetical protein
MFDHHIILVQKCTVIQCTVVTVQFYGVVTVQFYGVVTVQFYGVVTVQFYGNIPLYSHTDVFLSIHVNKLYAADLTAQFQKLMASKMA